MDPQSIQYKIVEKQGLTLIGKYGNQDTQELLSADIQSLSKTIKDISIPYSCQIVWSIDHPNSLYNTFLGFVVNSTENLGMDLHRCKIPSSTWGIFEFSGKSISFIQFLESIYTDWLPYAGYEHYPKNCTHLHFSIGDDESLNMDLPPEEHTHSWEIWIPIRKK